MTLSGFDERWRWITNRAGGETNVVQERHELEHVYNLMEAAKCTSYLEVGSAEGDSLYVLGNIPETIHYIDLGENHTRDRRNEVIELLKSKYIVPHHGDSNSMEIARSLSGMFDCVLIDAGHHLLNVVADAILYAPLASKYVFFHDVQLPEVKAAIQWFNQRWPLGSYREFINSENYGYGIIEVGKC